MSQRQSVRARAVSRRLPPRPVESLEPRRLLNGDGRPVATLEANPIEIWSTTYVFKVTYTDDQGIDVHRLGDNNLTIRGSGGYERGARFWKWVPNGMPGSVTAFYRISAPGGFWSAADNGAYSVSLNPHQVRDIHGNSARAVTFGKFEVAVPQYPSDVSATLPTNGIIGIDVTQFGAIPNDGIDDTAAIQRAIDSLPRGQDGVPDALGTIGGIIALPAGTFNTSAPLRIPSAVRLRGQGDATVILNTSSNPAQAAIELTSIYGHGYNIRAGVEQLSIQTSTAKGITTSGMSGNLVALRLNEVTISAGGVAIDLRDIRAYSTEMRNITIRNPGSTALWMGTFDGHGAVNHINGFTVTGTARAGFRAERGMIVLGGDVVAEGLSIGQTGASVTPLYATGRPLIHGLEVLATSNIPGNVIAKFEDIWYAEVDGMSPLGPGRRVEIRSSREVRVENLELLPGARLSDSVSVDSSSHLTVQTLRITTDPGPMTNSRITVRGAGLPTPYVSASSRFSEPMRPVSSTVVDVRAFGAIPNDGIDDTAAIQAAINALPRGGGIPGVGDPVGGVVVLSPGIYTTSAPISVPSGVWIRGHGNGTTVRNTASDPSRGAFEFVGDSKHGFNVGAAIQDVTIHTTRASGIRADASITSGLIDARINGVQVSAGARGIDLGDVRTFHFNLHNVMISEPGSTPFVLGDVEGYSADNRILGLQLQGRIRRDFQAERALVELRGNYFYQNGWIEQPDGARVLPLLLSGSGTVRGLWLEYPPQYLSDGIVMQFENTTDVVVDRLIHIDPRRRLNLVNAKGVRINMLNLDGTPGTLRDNIAVDDASRLSLGMVYAQRDAGLLDHPRVRVESAYNGLDKSVVQNTTPAPGQNLLADPLFAAFSGDKQDHTSGWRVQWGDSLGAVNGTVTVEQGPNGPRLKVVVTSNPNQRRVAIAGALQLPSTLTGTAGVVRYRIDGPGTAVVYTSGYAKEYSGRVMNGATAVRTPQPLQSGEEIIFVLPATVGTWYISGVSVVAG